MKDDGSEGSGSTGHGERDALLRFLESDLPLDDLFEQLVLPAPPGDDGPSVQVVLPETALDTPGPDLSELLGSVFAEYDEIEALLSDLRDETGDWAGMEEANAIAFISEEELQDPEALTRALAPLHSEAAKFELLFGHARRALERLQGYQVSRRSPEELVRFLRGEERLRSVQCVVEFLASLQTAAESFESIELPHPDIREYLEHLYRMRDWEEMGRLVRLLEVAVRKYLRVQG